MNIFDRIVLLATGLVLGYGIRLLWQRHQTERTQGPHNLYYLVSFVVFLTSGLLLIGLGWDILANDLVAVVATLIPFGLAAGLVRRHFPNWGNGVVVFLTVGLLIITTTRFAEMRSVAKFAYPFFHSCAALIVVAVPIHAVWSKKRPLGFAALAVGGSLISLGGIALAFLSAGRQLLFLSHDVVLMIFAPLLFFTAMFFAVGVSAGREPAKT